MIIFECTHCGEEMEVSDRQAGRWLDCVACGTTIEVRERPFKRPRIRRTTNHPDARSQLEYVWYGLAYLTHEILSAILLYFRSLGSRR